MIPHEPPHERPHGPHRPEPWGAPEPHPEAPWRGPAPWGPYYMGRAFGPWWVPWYERSVPETDDQLPLISHVGRGIQGNGYRIEVVKGGPGEMYLKGSIYDPATKEWTDDWLSDNVAGGTLLYQYNLRDWTDPKTFTITFKYKHPGYPEDEWVWTTPAIPYLLDGSGQYDPSTTDLNTRFGSLFMKKTQEQWILSGIPTNHSMDDAKDNQEKLIYPEGWDREDFNAPVPGEDWTVNLDYGIGGSIDAPNADDIAKLLGITPEQVDNIIDDVPNQFEGNGIKGDNVKDYVDDLLDHIHKDMGFDDELVADEGTLTYTPKWYPVPGVPLHVPTIKMYVDARCDDIEHGMAEIVNHIAGCTVNPDGTFEWPGDDMVATGNINLYSGEDEQHYIRTHDDPSIDHDVKAV